MNKKVLILVIVLAVMAAGALVYLTVFDRDGETDDNLLVPTAAADIYEDANRLEVNEGSVTVRHESGQEDVVTDKAEVVVGDTLVVSEDGKATLYWFDHSISRLAAGTEMTIDQAAYNPDNINETNISFEVLGGEVWSKVQAIVEEDSEFLGYAGNVVAGVRGSVFNIAVDGDEVVLDSIAHALTVGDKTLTSGEEGRYKKDGEELSKTAISSDDWDRPWFRYNLESDKADQARMRGAMMEKLRKTIGALPGEPNFEDKMARLDEFMKSDADPAKKRAVKAKIVALMRAMDFHPNDPLFPIKVQIQEKLIEWEDNDSRREFLLRKRLENRLYQLDDWVRENNPTAEELRAYFKQFKDVVAAYPDFFERFPELQGMMERNLSILNERMPELSQEVDFLRIMTKINALKESMEGIDRTDPIKSIEEIKDMAEDLQKEVELLNVNPLYPPITTETPDIINMEAPFYQGESNV